MEIDPTPLVLQRFSVYEVVSRAFLTAHLLTADLRAAERVTMDAIAAWDCEEEFEDRLFLNILSAATEAGLNDPAGPAPGKDSLYLPSALQTVLTLPSGPRHCFVLHVLVGLGLADCALLVHLQPEEIVERLMIAYAKIAPLDRPV